MSWCIHERGAGKVTRRPRRNDSLKHEPCLQQVVHLQVPQCLALQPLRWPRLRRGWQDHNQPGESTRTRCIDGVQPSRTYAFSSSWNAAHRAATSSYEPWAATRPPSITTTRSARSACSTWFVTNSLVLPASAPATHLLNRCCPTHASTAAVGSSRMKLCDNGEHCVSTRVHGHSGSRRLNARTHTSACEYMALASDTRAF